MDDPLEWNPAELEQTGLIVLTAGMAMILLRAGWWMRYAVEQAGEVNARTTSSCLEDVTAVLWAFTRFCMYANRAMHVCWLANSRQILTANHVQVDCMDVKQCMHSALCGTELTRCRTLLCSRGCPAAPRTCSQVLSSSSSYKRSGWLEYELSTLPPVTRKLLHLVVQDAMDRAPQ